MPLAPTLKQPAPIHTRHSREIEAWVAPLPPAGLRPIKVSGACVQCARCDKTRHGRRGRTDGLGYLRRMVKQQHKRRDGRSTGGTG